MDAIALMASTMRASQARLDVAAANLANVSSDGFHKSVVRLRLLGDGVLVSRSMLRAPGELERTGRAFDLAIAGKGSLFVADGRGHAVATRGGAFERDGSGRLLDSRGRALLGAHGPIRVGPDAAVDANGRVDGGDRLRTSPGARVVSGFLERPDVDAVGEMIDVLSAQRSFETAQKTLVALDQTRQKDADDVARVKS